jgi:hypothetical protein
MAKFETLFCVLTWGLTNALFVAVAFGSADPIDPVQPAHVELASVAPTPTA